MPPYPSHEPNRDNTEFVPTDSSELIGIMMNVAVNVETDEVIIHFPDAFIQVTQVVHEEGILKMQVRRIDR